jgi:hypothetical protein
LGVRGGERERERERGRKRRRKSKEVGEGREERLIYR